MNGYGLLAVYKSDWMRFGGKLKKKSSSTVTVESRDLPINRDLSIGDERDDGDELHRERTGSRTSFTAGKFER